MTADAEVVKDDNGKWHVNYWMPEKFHGPPAVSAAQKTAKKTARPSAKKAKTHEGRRRGAACRAQSTRTKGLWLRCRSGSSR